MDYERESERGDGGERRKRGEEREKWERKRGEEKEEQKRKTTKR